MPYEKYDLRRDARLALNYLTRMVDPRYDYLPYWFIAANENPASARHVRVDDAELVASWYEALVCTQEVLGTREGAEVLDGFKKHLMRSWGEHGLRFHEPYPWAATMHSSFHEMAYVVAALNRWLEREPDNRLVRKRLRGLVRGMRRLVYQRKVRTFWSGDTKLDERVYVFPNDVYLKGKGWDLSCFTGRGEESVRNGMILHPLVKSYQLFGDEVALDLAVGTANYLLGSSRYFNWKGEFFGHVHSAVWVAGGLVLLGRLTGEKRYVERGRDIFNYVLGMSSSYGWVPEYAQWHPMEEEHCETCCIRDMILCAFELIDAGDHGLWDMVNRFARNQMSEQQIKTGSFVGVDNSIADTTDKTFKDIDKRIVGGWSGGGEPNSIALNRFRSVAGCCVGTAPQAMHQVWTNIVRQKGRRISVNLPIDKDDARATVATGYPNEGWMQVTVRRSGDFAVRVHPFMRKGLTAQVNGRTRRIATNEEDCLEFPDVRKGAVIRLEHDIRNVVRNEIVGARPHKVTWRGCDVAHISPEGEPLRLYQRRTDIPKEIPAPPRKKKLSAAMDLGPTQMKR